MTTKTIPLYAKLLASGLFLCSFFLEKTASAQSVFPATGTSLLEGKILDAQDKKPLQGASISFLNFHKGVIADVNGRFRLPVEKGQMIPKLIVGYIGYQTDTLMLQPDFNPDSASLTVLLFPATHKTDQSAVTVYYNKKSTEISLLGAIKQEKIGGVELLRAACCNLSESFETTPSVDIGYTDAISGYRQIEMLGLAGANTFYTRENIPENRGLASITGLTFTPGTWLEGIQLSKGTGSVVNGYEGVAGQINTEWLKPFEKTAPKLLLNGYQSGRGRSEGNLVINHALNERLSTNLLLYNRVDWHRNDQNKDGFMDNPVGDLFVGANRWFYFSPKGLQMQGGIKAVHMDNTGGRLDFHFDKGNPDGGSDTWGYHSKIKRLEGWAKIGKVYVDRPYKSMGLQLSGVTHDQRNLYGSRIYNATQKSFYANYIYQSIISNTNHIIKAGASFQLDNFRENFDNWKMQRSEIVPGAFVEYTYNYLSKLNIVAGLRGDHHNLFGGFLTPRLHIRYAPFEKTAIRASVGRAQRTANFLSENTGLMASNRQFLLNGIPLENTQQGAYPLKPEIAWNTGVNIIQKFTLGYRDGSFTVDYYYTRFHHQIITDFESAGLLNFYNLSGKSYSHSLNFQLDYELIHKLNLRWAYRYLDVKSTFDGRLKERPLVAKGRAFFNANYETRNKWKLNYTLQWTSAKRLPATSVYSEKQSPSFFQMNAQLNKSFMGDKLELYAGIENLTNYMQKPLILLADDPGGPGFDASQIWGPTMGRNLYIGFRWKL